MHRGFDVVDDDDGGKIDVDFDRAAGAVPAAVRPPPLVG
jgi:hypothetical protein